MFGRIRRSHSGLRAVVYAMLALVLFSVFGATTARAQYSSASEFSHVRGIPNLPGYDMRWLHFGFLIGFVVLDYHIYNTGARTLENNGIARYAEVTDLDPGLALGIVTDFRLCNHLNFRILPGISFGSRHLLFVDENGKLIDEEPVRIKSTFVESPFLLKYGAKRINNIRPFVVGGVTPRFDLAKDKQECLRMKSMDCYADFGGGMDFYLTYFRFSLELRGSFGLFNVYNKKGSDDIYDIPYQQAIDHVKSRWWGFTMYFE